MSNDLRYKTITDRQIFELHEISIFGLTRICFHWERNTKTIDNMNYEISLIFDVKHNIAYNNVTVAIGFELVLPAISLGIWSN